MIKIVLNVLLFSGFVLMSAGIGAIANSSALALFSFGLYLTIYSMVALLLKYLKGDFEKRQ